LDYQAITKWNGVNLRRDENVEWNSALVINAVGARVVFVNQPCLYGRDASGINLNGTDRVDTGINEHLSQTDTGRVVANNTGSGHASSEACAEVRSEEAARKATCDQSPQRLIFCERHRWIVRMTL